MTSIIPELYKKINLLEEKLALYKKNKDSSNSHKPPSSDMSPPQRNKSLREKSNKKPGGQKGHEGTTLQFSDQVDEVIKYAPEKCDGCGKDLSQYAEHLIERRQELDLPIITVKRTEHQTYGKQCACGCHNYGKFPAHINSSIQYGCRIEALIAYLHARQYIPYERTKEFFRDILGVSISSGGINYLLRRFSDKAVLEYENIRNAILKQQVVGTDETGVKVNGEKHWFWTWQNSSMTFIAHSSNRGYQTIIDNFPKGLPNTFLNHDRWAAHFQCPAKGHQICISHLLRELNFLEELYKSKWAVQLKKLLDRALKKKKEMILQHYSEKNRPRNILMKELKNLLHKIIPKKEQKTITFQKQLRKHIDCILLFLFHPEIPPDNNGSERAIRNLKVKQKISGCFKSIHGAKNYAIIRSLIDTAIKAGLQVFPALVKIATLGTE